MEEKGKGKEMGEKGKRKGNEMEEKGERKREKMEEKGGKRGEKRGTKGYVGGDAQSPVPVPPPRCSPWRLLAPGLSHSTTLRQSM